MKSVVAILLAGLVSEQAAASPVVLYTCTIGAKQARVSRDGERLIYEYGAPQKPEIQVAGDAASGVISYLHSSYPHAQHEQLRFRSGAYSYVLYWRWASPDYQQRGGEDAGGLLVFKGPRRIAMRSCTGDVFPDNDLFGKLPTDGDDITPDPGER